MYLIQNISASPLQTMTLTLYNGNPVQLSIYFRPMQLGWFINSLTYQDFTLTGLRITNSPNFLYQFKNKIPFGMGCYSTQKREPTQSQDFSTGANQLFLLNASEVLQLTEFYQNASG